MSLLSRLLLCLTLLGLALSPAAAADSAPSAVQLQRAEKIAAALTLADPAQATRVRDLIARQYLDLSVIHAARDAAVAAALDTTGKADALAIATAAQDALHPQYLARLAAELNPAQVDQVKDGMTYGVVPLTFRVYGEMLPNLTPEQKAQILAWLTEAREHAMDASTSKEKHAWFGKYKGRINNYLAKAGFDMKQAEKDMLARKQAAKDPKNEG